MDEKRKISITKLKMHFYIKSQNMKYSQTMYYLFWFFNVVYFQNAQYFVTLSIKEIKIVCYG